MSPKDTKTALWLVVREPVPRAHVVELDAEPSSAESPSEAAAFSGFVRDARPGESVVVRVIGLHGAGVWRFIAEVPVPVVRIHALTSDNLRLAEISAATGLPVSLEAKS